MLRCFARRSLAALILALTMWASRATAQAPLDPWDTTWLPANRAGRRAVDASIDALLDGTGLEGQGTTIRACAQQYGVNPAFVLAMFRQEAGFAASGTRAHDNCNPLNIIATGDCYGQPAGFKCAGFYGEVSTDGRFGIYARVEDGIRAAFWLLDREYRGLSLHGTISRACPPVECDVDRYTAQIGAWGAEYQATLQAAAAPATPPGEKRWMRVIGGLLALLLLVAWVSSRVLRQVGWTWP